jgi:hypothetical protein
MAGHIRHSPIRLCGIVAVSAWTSQGGILPEFKVFDVRLPPEPVVVQGIVDGHWPFWSGHRDMGYCHCHRQRWLRGPVPERLSQNLGRGLVGRGPARGVQLCYSHGMGDQCLLQQCSAEDILRRCTGGATYLKQEHVRPVPCWKQDVLWSVGQHGPIAARNHSLTSRGHTPWGQ